jgi:hypothetical protein
MKFHLPFILLLCSAFGWQQLSTPRRWMRLTMLSARLSPSAMLEAAKVVTESDDLALNARVALQMKDSDMDMEKLRGEMEMEKNELKVRGEMEMEKNELKLRGEMEKAVLKAACEHNLAAITQR